MSDAKIRDFKITMADDVYNEVVQSAHERLIGVVRIRVYERIYEEMIRLVDIPVGIQGSTEYE